MTMTPRRHKADGTAERADLKTRAPAKDQNRNSKTTEIQVIREAIRSRLESLRRDHRNLDIAVGELSSWSNLSELQVQELKKRKLVVKDAIAELESGLLHDLIE